MNSPCVARCGLNDDDFCMGCHRHIDEIVAWGKIDDEQKLIILAKLDERKKKFQGENNTGILSRDKWLESERNIKKNNKNS
ncbi:DUF1289 domain-containing protein [Shewanella sp. OPT22]|nr:DUF1289 domain-containing protein [Parashewanella hymeniacidonis]RYV04152.1 DUF1289 domain-containing protein [Shewanella sp. OPT22]